MVNLNIIRNFSLKDENVKVIKENLEKVCKYAMNHDGKLSKMADRTFASVDGEVSNYNEMNEKTKLALLFPVPVFRTCHARLFFCKVNLFPYLIFL